METRRGRPKNPDAPTAAERKRKQRAATGKATAEAIRAATLAEFGMAVLMHCNGTDDGNEATVMEILERVAQAFPQGERQKVYRYYMPASDADDDTGRLFRFPNRRRR